MGKSTVLSQESERLKRAVEGSGGDVLCVDLAALGSDIAVRQRIFQSESFVSWMTGRTRLYLLLDGFDTCLQSSARRVPTDLLVRRGNPQGGWRCIFTASWRAERAHQLGVPWH